MTSPSDLHGSWLLRRWDSTVEGVFHGYPMGEDAVGQIVYNPDGHMAAILSMRDRARFNTSQFHKGSPDQRDAAAVTYVSYGGTYEVVAEVVTHHVAFSLFPDWVGTDLVRTVSWDDDELVLTSIPEISGSGRSVVNRLFWRRGERVAPQTT
jgi:hypothetical protein